MGYRFSRQTTFASYSLYHLLYGREPILPSFVQEKLKLVIELDGPNVWAQCLCIRAELLKRVMQMTS